MTQSVLYQECPTAFEGLDTTFTLRPGEIRPGSRVKVPGNDEWLFVDKTRSDGNFVVLTVSDDPPRNPVEHRIHHQERIEVAAAWDDGSTPEERERWPQCHWHCHEECTTKHRSLDAQCSRPRILPWRDGHRCDGDGLLCGAERKARERAAALRDLNAKDMERYGREL